MKKILIGYILDGKHSGIDKYLLNVLDILLQEGYSVDFLTTEFHKDFSDFLNSKGVDLFEIPTLKHPYRQYTCIRKIIKKNQYDIVYFNISEAFNCIGILAASKENVSKIMVHSHSSNTSESKKIKRYLKRILHTIFKKIVVCKKSTDFYACSKNAAEWMYTPQTLKSASFSVINNAIETSRFEYNDEIRQQKRQQLNLTGKYVIGHVSGFSKPKNTIFLVEIINELRKINDDVVLLLVGSGKDFEKVKNKVLELELEKYVRLLGIRDDVNELLQAMDIFVLPSFFEGLPIVAIEAQIAGLKVILSDTISREVSLSNKCIFESIRKSPKVWAELIFNNLEYNRSENDFSNTNYCFDIAEQRKIIKDMFR